MNKRQRYPEVVLKALRDAGEEIPTYNKYSNQPTFVDGVRFDSAGEADLWMDLLLLQQHGSIRNLERQVRYEFVLRGIKIAEYRLDFRFWDVEKKNWRHIDFKGVRTDAFIMKKKMMLAFFQINVEEARTARKDRYDSGRRSTKSR